jgi:hypothetical protein
MIYPFPAHTALGKGVKILVDQLGQPRSRAGVSFLQSGEETRDVAAWGHKNLTVGVLAYGELKLYNMAASAGVIGLVPGTVARIEES